MQFYNNLIGTITVLAFDAAHRKFEDGSYYAPACKFQIGVVIVPDPQSQLAADQLFPLEGGAAPLPGATLQVGPLTFLIQLLLLLLLAKHPSGFKV